MPEYGTYGEPDPATSDEIPRPRPTSRSRVVDPTAYDPADPYADPYSDHYDPADPHAQSTNHYAGSTGSYARPAEPYADPTDPSDPYAGSTGPYARTAEPYGFPPGSSSYGTSRSPEPSPDHPRRIWPYVLLGSLGVVLIAVAVNVAFSYIGDMENGGDGNTEVGSSSITTSTPTSTTAPANGEAAVEPSTVGDPSVIVEPPATGPYVEATYDGERLIVSGTVPSEEASEAMLTIAQVVYGPERVQPELIVDETIGTPPAWMEAAPAAIRLLQIVNHAKMVIADGQILVEGRSGSTDGVTYLTTELSKATGLPVVTGEFEILDLRAAIYVLAYSEGKLALSGALPTEELRLGFVEAAAAIFGEDNVVDASTVDPAVGPELWMKDAEALVGVLSAFDDFETRIEGDRVTSRLSGGPTFEVGSSEISPELGAVLNFAAVVMLREPGMTQVIRGHTDATGPEELNLALSQERADAAKAYMMAAGIEPERITAIGLGSAEPIADDATPEGRSRNRRIELSVELDPDAATE